jgi:thiamine kinase-like enzyme
VWNGRDSPVGPFESAKTFTDAFFALGRNLPQYPNHPFFKSFRSAFSDDASIVFTHADLNPGNIMMSATSSDVLAIIDWHGGGWYPDFWEYIKAFWTVDWKSSDDWKDYVGKFAQPAYENELLAFIQYEQTGCLI